MDRTYQVGRVVLCKAGREKGRLLCVVGSEGEGSEQTLLLADGKERPLERPKAKNPKHAAPTHTVLDSGSMSTNRSLRRALAALAAEKTGSNRPNGNGRGGS